MEAQGGTIWHTFVTLGNIDPCTNEVSANVVLTTASGQGQLIVCEFLPATWLWKSATMRCCYAKGALLRTAGATFATALAVSACASGANSGTSPAPRVVTTTVTVTATASASAPPPSSSSPAPTSSPSPSSASSSSLTAYYLADFSPVQGYGINVDTSPHTVNAVTYEHPVSWSVGFSGNPYWAEWDLSRDCTWLTSPGVGLDDDSPSGAAAVFWVQADGVYKWQKTISLGQSDSLKISIKGALRLRLTSAETPAGTGGNGTWGDAQVWCTAEPPNSTGQ